MVQKIIAVIRHGDMEVARGEIEIANRLLQPSRKTKGHITGMTRCVATKLEKITSCKNMRLRIQIRNSGIFKFIRQQEAFSGYFLANPSGEGVMGLTDEARRLLRKGWAIATEIPPSATGLKAWVGVHPFIQDGSPGGSTYEGSGTPSYAVHQFEVRKSSLDADFDVVGELLNKIRVDVASEEEVEHLLMSWGIDPSSLSLPDDEYPL